MLQLSSRITSCEIIKKILLNRLSVKLIYVGRVATPEITVSLNIHSGTVIAVSHNIHIRAIIVSTVTLYCLSHLVFPRLWHSLIDIYNVYSVEVYSHVIL